MWFLLATTADNVPSWFTLSSLSCNIPWISCALILRGVLAALSSLMVVMPCLIAVLDCRAMAQILFLAQFLISAADCAFIATWKRHLHFGSLSCGSGVRLRWLGPGSDFTCSIIGAAARTFWSPQQDLLCRYLACIKVVLQLEHTSSGVANALYWTSSVVVLSDVSSRCWQVSLSLCSTFDWLCSNLVRELFAQSPFLA